MARIIAIVNQKGGVGKTTTAINLGAGIANEGKRVLLIDLDAQGSLTKSLAVDVSQSDRTAFELLGGRLKASEVIRNLPGGYDLIPADIRLASLESITEPGREYRLQEALEEVAESYDYVLIDCSPSLGVLTFNALAACTEVLVPLQAEFLALTGIAQLTQTVQVVQKRLNQQAEITGVLMTMYDKRRNLTKDVEAKINEYFPQAVFNTRIRNNVALAEAPINGVDIFQYDPSSNGAKDYAALTEEVLARDFVAQVF